MIGLFLLICFSTLTLNAIMPLTSHHAFDADAEARKKAETEYSALSKRGWVVSEGNLLDVLILNWEKRLAKDEEGLNVYMIAYGNATASSIQDAEEEALMKAREQISGPMIMYFQSWNMAAQSKGDVTAEEAMAIRNAVNTTEKDIKQAFIDLEIIPDLNMYREQRRGFEVHIRIVHPQMELRQLAKEIIATELAKTAGWDKEKSFRLMTYPK
jgi:hypothetical protein